MTKEEYVKSVNAFDIKAIEDCGSHVLLKHEGLTDKQMKIRCKTEKKDIVSCFSGNRSEIETLIKETMLDGEFETPECVCEWLSDNSDGGLFFCVKDFPYPVGKGYFRRSWHHWKDGAVECSSVIVVLQKIECAYDTVYKIVTAYPSATEEDIQRYRNSHR